jgi:group I intron endonuclease
MAIVYQATNLVNGNAYIGVTTSSLKRRRSQHLVSAASGGGFLFHKAIRKYGPGAFEWTILEKHRTAKAAYDAEVRLIAMLRPTYNMTKGGESGMAGVQMRPETKAKIAAAHRGIGHGPEARAKIGAASRGRIPTPETRAKLSAAHRGHTTSSETRAKIGSAHRGRKRSPEAIEAVAAALRGRKQSPEAVAKRAAALKGREITLAHRAKISAANTGRKRTVESRAKMSAAKKGKPNFALRGRHPTAETIEKMREAGKRRSDFIDGFRAMGPAASSRRVYCLDDGLFYPSASAAAVHYGIAKSALIELCLGKRGRKTVGGKRFAYTEE